MVAAICYAWLLQNRLVKGKGEGDEAGTVVVPVMNLKRQKMWKQRQAAWLFSHLGLDAALLLFADEELRHLLQGDLLGRILLRLQISFDTAVTLALKIKAETKGTKLKDFVATMQSSHFQSEIASLRQNVEEYAKQFPTIGFEKATMKYKN